MLAAGTADQFAAHNDGKERSTPRAIAVVGHRIQDAGVVHAESASHGRGLLSARCGEYVEPNASMNRKYCAPVVEPDPAVHAGSFEQLPPERCGCVVRAKS